MTEAARSVEATRSVEGAVRASYGRLISYLSARSGDVAGAEDALSEAVMAALRTWPTGGVPSNPEGWLLHAARRRLIDQQRRRQTQREHADVLRQLAEAEELSAVSEFPDERLRLLFVCAHPAIDPRLHTPLMLQTVWGLDAAAIAAAFVVPAATMGQRLSRAKAKIQQTRIAFEVPSGSELAPRLFAVLEAIYAAYGRAWDDVTDADATRRGLADEALWLARTLTDLMPDEPEALGLLSLLYYCEARSCARRTPNGEYVAFSKQDPATWDEAKLLEAERLLNRAFGFGRAGRFQLEAAIQSAHVERIRSGNHDWHAIAALYEGLVRVAPTLGALVGRALAHAEAHGPSTGLALLDALPPEVASDYQPYWAARAHCLRQLAHPDADAALARAIALTDDPAVRTFLATRVTKT